MLFFVARQELTAAGSYGTYLAVDAGRVRRSARVEEEEMFGAELGADDASWAANARPQWPNTPFCASTNSKATARGPHQCERERSSPEHLTVVPCGPRFQLAACKSPVHLLVFDAVWIVQTADGDGASGLFVMLYAMWPCWNVLVEPCALDAHTNCRQLILAVNECQNPHGQSSCTGALCSDA
jgi:hypothetical protein